MAKAKKFSIDGVNSGIELIKAFNEYNALPEDKREKLELTTEKAKVVFYPTSGNVWVGWRVIKKTGEVTEKFGDFHNLSMNKDHAAYEQAFKVVDKEKKRAWFRHYTWTTDREIWYTERNEDLIKALDGAF